jgi:hypothetical protein
MRNKWVVVIVGAIGVSIGAAGAAAQGPMGVGGGSVGGGAPAAAPKTESSHPSHSYNPLNWVKKGPKSATEELDAKGEQDFQLTSRLRTLGVLPAKADLKDVCSAFKELGECVAALHASHNLGVNYSCLKWDVTGAKPSADASSCTAPASGKAMSLGNAIHALKPGANAKAETKNAEKQAHDDLKEVKM